MKMHVPIYVIHQQHTPDTRKKCTASLKSWFQLGAWAIWCVALCTALTVKLADHTRIFVEIHPHHIACADHLHQS